MKDVFSLWAIVLAVMGMKAFVDFSDRGHGAPSIDWSSGEGRLVLPRRMQAALDRAHAPFGGSTYRMRDFPADVADSHGARTSYTSPFAVIDDFNGDDRLDVVLLQHSPWGSRIDVILDRVGRPSVVVLGDTFGPNRWNHLERLRLSAVGPGRLRYHPTAESAAVELLTVYGHAFRVQRDDRRSDVYRWENGQFVGVPMYD